LLKIFARLQATFQKEPLGEINISHVVRMSLGFLSRALRMAMTDRQAYTTVVLVHITSPYMIVWCVQKYYLY
jgi:hypothetical protein